MSEWQEVRLGDVLTLQRGFDLPKRNRVPGPYPVVSSSGITGSHAEYKVEGPGVVIGRYGSLGSVHWVDGPFWPLNTSLWVKDFKGNDPRFISYLLRTVRMDGSSAAAVPGVNRNHLHDLSVAVPAPPAQRRISVLLRALDEHIDLCRRLAEAFENVVLTCFRETSRKATSQKQLRELTRLDTTHVDPRRHPATVFELFSIPAFDAGGQPVGQLGAEIKSGKSAVDGERVLVSKLNPRIPRVWRAQPRTDHAIASTEFLVLAAAEVSTAWLWGLFSDRPFREWSVAVAGGTSTSHQRMQARDLLSYPAPVFGTTEMEWFDRIAAPALDCAQSHRERASHLMALRDLLLNRLLSGELGLGDIDLGGLMAEAA